MPQVHSPETVLLSFWCPKDLQPDFAAAARRSEWGSFSGWARYHLARAAGLGERAARAAAVAHVPARPSAARGDTADPRARLHRRPSQGVKARPRRSGGAGETLAEDVGRRLFTGRSVV